MVRFLYVSTVKMSNNVAKIRSHDHSACIYRIIKVIGNVLDLQQPVLIHDSSLLTLFVLNSLYIDVAYVSVFKTWCGCVASSWHQTVGYELYVRTKLMKK